ncbi:43324_t:CDS:1, partial [Gigaspora margarita]
TTPYRIAYIINIGNNRQDVGGPVFQFRTLSTASYFDILTGSIINIALMTHLDDIIKLCGVFLVSVGQ